MPTATRHFKNAIYEQLGRIGKAPASPRRLELLDLLCQGPRTVETLAHDCRGPYCVLSAKAVEALRARGYCAIRMEEGVPDWRARGLPVEVYTKENQS